MIKLPSPKVPPSQILNPQAPKGPTPYKADSLLHARK